MQARWCDGRTSRVDAVRIGLVGGLLEIVFENGERRHYPSTSARLLAPLGRTERIIRLADGASLSLADCPELAQWFPDSDPVQRIVHWFERSWPTVLVAVVLLLASLFAFQQWLIPGAARAVAERVPAEIEALAARHTLALLQDRLFKPSQLAESRRSAITAQFQALVADLPRGDDYRLLFLAAPELGANALMLPDGTTILTDEMVELAASDAELLAVLAHEAGHHEHRHGMRLALQSMALLAAIGIATGDAGSAASMASSVGLVLIENGYSRDFEREADAFATALLTRNGHPASALSDIFARMLEQHGDALDTGLLGYFSTHPSTAERIEAARRANAQRSDTKDGGDVEPH